MKLVRSPHPHARIRAIDAAAALAVPGVQLVLTHEDSPPTHYSTGRHEHPGRPRRHAVVRPRGALRGPAGGRRGGRHGRRRRAGGRAGPGRLRAAAGRVRPEAAMAPGAPLLHGDKGPERDRRPGRNLAGEIHSRIGDVAAGFAAGGRGLRGDVRGPAGPARRTWRRTPRSRWIDDDGRLVVRTQQPDAVPDPRRAGPAVRAPARSGPGVHRPGRRRLRRQAGDADRGRRGAGRAAAAAAGAARAHPRGAVQRHHHAPPDARRASRSAPTRDGRADGDRAAERVRHRRLRQPRPAACCTTAAASRSRCIAAPTSSVDALRRSTPTRSRPGRSAATG